MATELPDCLPPDIQPTAHTPLFILRHQASLLTERAGGIIQAEVVTSESGAKVQHGFDLVAPAFNFYRERLFSVRHHKRRLFPVIVQAPCFNPHRNWGLNPTSFSSSLLEKVAPDEREAASEQEFIGLLKQVFASTDAKAAINSLIAMSNDRTEHRRFPEAPLDNGGAGGADAAAPDEQPSGPHSSGQETAPPPPAPPASPEEPRDPPERA